MISTHAPLAGRDRDTTKYIDTMLKFQPTRPLRGATPHSSRLSGLSGHFNPRAPCGARLDRLMELREQIVEISTHAPLAGRDSRGLKKPRRSGFISTHAPLAGRDFTLDLSVTATGISTHAPLAGRDLQDAVLRCLHPDFNPRAPCGARPPRRSGCTGAGHHFNPRAPCGARRGKMRDNVHPGEFQPTRPLRGATDDEVRRGVVEEISTHAPLAGRDGAAAIEAAGSAEFQPTRPLRGATQKKFSDFNGKVFQPTRPLRGATQEAVQARILYNISTHAPLAGRDEARGRRITVPF